MNVEKNNMPSTKDVNILYLVCMILFVVTGIILVQIELPLLNYYSKMFSIFITQFLFIFLPLLLYVVYRKIDIKRTFRFNKVSFINIIISIFVMGFAVPIASSLNGIILLILSYFGKMHAQPLFPSDNIQQLSINILVIALVPAIFEELLFRGAILRGYESQGKVKAILISSLLFALLHRDVQSLIGTFILGLTIAYIVYRTNSIFTGIAAHFANNGFIVFLTYITSKFQNVNIENNQNIIEQFKTLDVATIIAMIVIIVFILTIAIAIFIGLILLLRYTTRNINRDVCVFKIKNDNYYTYAPLIVSFILVFYGLVKQLL